MTLTSPWKHLAMTVTFLGVGLTMFTDGVRTAQVLGLLASGAASGVFLARAIASFRSAPADPQSPPGS